MKKHISHTSKFKVSKHYIFSDYHFGNIPEHLEMEPRNVSVLISQSNFIRQSQAIPSFAQTQV